MYSANTFLFQSHLRYVFAISLPWKSLMTSSAPLSKALLWSLSEMQASWLRGTTRFVKNWLCEPGLMKWPQISQVHTCLFDHVCQEASITWVWFCTFEGLRPDSSAMAWRLGLGLQTPPALQFACKIGLQGRTYQAEHFSPSSFIWRQRFQTVKVTPKFLDDQNTGEIGAVWVGSLIFNIIS